MRGATARSQPEREAGRGGGLSVARRRDLVQRAAAEPAAEHSINGRNAERERASRIAQAKRSFGGAQLVAQPADRGPPRQVHGRSFGCSHGLIRGKQPAAADLVHDLFL